MPTRDLGNPLGNPLALPKAGAVASPLQNDPVIVDFASAAGASGVYQVPGNFRYMRVTAVGAGGGGLNTTGFGAGGGGGLAQSAVIAINGRGVTVAYSTPGRPSIGVDGGNATASFLDVNLVATGGKAGLSGSGGQGGQGSGGFKNTVGGAGGQYSASTRGTGGGAAGISANGGQGRFGADYTFGAEPGGFAGTGGYRKDSSDTGGGGAGVGASLNNNIGWGTSPSKTDGSGGDWGGGGSANTGGFGGVRIELW